MISHTIDFAGLDAPISLYFRDCFGGSAGSLTVETRIVARRTLD